MTAVPRPLLLIIAMSLATHIGFGGSRVLASLFALHLGASALTIGVVVALYALLPLFLAVRAGQLIDRVGLRPPLVFGGIMIVSGLLVPFAFPNLIAVSVSATMLGVGFMAWQVAAQTMTGALSTSETRAGNFALLGMGFSASGLIGPIIAGVSIDLLGYRIAYAVLAVLPLVALVAVWAFPRWIPRRRQAEARGERRSSADLWRIPALRDIFIAGGILATAWDLFNFLLPVYARSMGLSASAIGVIMAVFAAATFLVRIVTARLARRYGEPSVLAGAIFCAAAGYAAFPFASGAVALAAISFVIGLGCGCGQPITMTLIYTLSPKGRAAEGTGIRVMINQLTHVVIPVTFGAVASAAGYVAVFAGCAAMLFGGGEFFRRSSAARRRREQVASPPPSSPPSPGGGAG